MIENLFVLVKENLPAIAFYVVVGMVFAIRVWVSKSRVSPNKVIVFFAGLLVLVFWLPLLACFAVFGAIEEIESKIISKKRQNAIVVRKS